MFNPALWLELNVYLISGDFYTIVNSLRIDEMR